MSTPESRLKSFAALATQAHEKLGPGFGFKLWDGTLVPANWPASALTLALKDEGVIASLMRKPRVSTIANLWATKRIDILNGNMLDLVAAKPRSRTRDTIKKIDKRLALKAALDFLFVPRGGPWPLESIGKDRESDGSQSENKKNIAFHYDVSNAFYALWLDKEMLYTSGYFHNWSDDLETAHQQKLEMICRKLRLQPGETLLDMGCGWGALSCYAAKNYGVIAYGVTLSEQQAAFANDKVKRLGLEKQVTIEVRDYATVEGEARFDKIAAIEMFEHIGAANFPTYFKTVYRLLKPAGFFLHQASTRPGKWTAVHGRGKRQEFQALTRFIFPGGELDYIGRTISSLELQGFEVHDLEAWREHYGRVCRMWYERLEANYDASCREVGEVTTRVWTAYLAATTLAFERNNCGLYQTLASKRVKGPAGLPSTRAHLYR